MYAHCLWTVRQDRVLYEEPYFSRNRAYDEPGAWLRGSQSEMPGASSAPNWQSFEDTPRPSDPCYGAVQPIGLEYFAPYGRLGHPDAFVELNNKRVPSTSLSFPSSDYPDVSEAAWFSTDVQDHPGASADQDELLWQNGGGFPGPPFPSSANLQEFEDPRQGTKVYEGLGDHAISTQNGWLGGMISDGTPGLEDHATVEQEVSHQSRAISENAVNENLSILTNESAPSLAVVASTAMKKLARKPKAPNADLAVTVRTRKLATPRVRKALPPKERHHEFAVTQQPGSCLRCRYSKRSVRASNHKKLK